MPDTQIDTSTAPLPLPSGGVPSLGDMTSDKFDKIVRQEADLYKRKIGAEGAAQAQYDALHKQARSRMEGLINQEAASVEDLKPWDVNKELEKTKTSLWDQFGSPGFIISMIGSAFSAMPMNTAFEAGAAAMNAQHQGKMDAYNKAFDAWKANTDLTMKRLDIEQSEFADVDKLWATDREAWKQRMESTLLRFNDQRKLLLLRNGMDQELMDSIAAQQKARQQIGIASQGIMENDLRRQLTQADPDWPIGPDGKPRQGEDGKPMRPDPQKMAAVVQRVEDRMRGIEGKTLSPDQEFMLKWHQENDGKPDATSEKFAKDYGAFRAAQYPAIRNPGLQSEPALLEQWSQTLGSEVPADVKGMIHTALAASPTQIVANQARLGDALAEIQQRKDTGETLKPDQVSQIVRAHLEQPANTGPIDDKHLADMGWTQRAIEAAAKTYNETGKLPTNLGNRQQAGIVSGKIQDKAAELLEKAGQTTEDRARNWQQYSTQRVAQNRFLSGPQGNTIRSLNTVVSHLQTLQDLADALKNGNIPRFNAVAQRWAEENGKAAPTNFDTAKQIVGAEIIKALGVAGAGTEAERHEASESFKRANSPAQIAGSIDTSKRLLIGQLKSLRRQFVASTGLKEDKFDSMLEPETRGFFEVDDSQNDHPSNLSDDELKKKLGIP